MNGPEIATVSIRRIPFDNGAYAFQAELAGVPLEDHPLYRPDNSYGCGIEEGLRRIGAAIESIEQAGP